jgi:thiamine-monophosphate kinase
MGGSQWLSCMKWLRNGVGEFDLIAQFFTRSVKRAALGVGDDCALIQIPPTQQLAVTTDMLVEGRHFFPEADPYRLGWKCLAVNLSDLAAMGATPRYITLSLALPEADPVWLSGFSSGLFALADAFDVELIGGDTTKGPRTISITAMGEIPPGQALRRDGAKLGDDIWVSHEIGGAALQLFYRWGRTTWGPEIPAAQIEALVLRMEMPNPRVALGTALRTIATAAIDLSDGLTGDLRHILKQSCCGAQLFLDHIPAPQILREKLNGPERALAQACLLSGGDDYELIFCAPQSARERVRMLLQALSLNGHVIGEITSGDCLVVLDAQGAEVHPPKSFDHFDA